MVYLLMRDIFISLKQYDIYIFIFTRRLCRSDSGSDWKLRGREFNLRSAQEIADDDIYSKSHLFPRRVGLDNWFELITVLTYPHSSIAVFMPSVPGDFITALFRNITNLVVKCSPWATSSYKVIVTCTYTPSYTSFLYFFGVQYNYYY